MLACRHQFFAVVYKFCTKIILLFPTSLLHSDTNRFMKMLYCLLILFRSCRDTISGPAPVEPKLPLTLQLDPNNLATMPEKTQGFTEDQVEDFKEVFQLFDTPEGGRPDPGDPSR